MLTCKRLTANTNPPTVLLQFLMHGSMRRLIASLITPSVWKLMTMVIVKARRCRLRRRAAWMMPS